MVDMTKLNERMVDFDEFTKDIDFNFSPEQLLFATFLSMPSKTRPSIEKISGALNLSVNCLYKWNSNKSIRTLVTRIVKHYYLSKLPDVVEKITQMATCGNSNMARIYLEHIAEWVSDIPKVQLNIQNNYSKEEIDKKITDLRAKTTINATVNISKS